MIVSGVICLVYEIVELFDCSFLLFVLMSEVVGCMSVQEGVKYLEKLVGGRGVLLGGVVGVVFGKVLILGGGIVGIEVVKMVVGLGVDVIIMDISLFCLCYFSDIMFVNVNIVYFNEYNICKYIQELDFIVGVVFIFGVKVLKFIMCEMLKLMCLGMVLVDVVVD